MYGQGDPMIGPHVYMGPIKISKRGLILTPLTPQKWQKMHYGKYHNLPRPKIENNCGSKEDLNFLRRATGSEIWPFVFEIPVRAIFPLLDAAFVQLD